MACAQCSGHPTRGYEYPHPDQRVAPPLKTRSLYAAMSERTVLHDCSQRRLPPGTSGSGRSLAAHGAGTRHCIPSIRARRPEAVHAVAGSKTVWWRRGSRAQHLFGFPRLDVGRCGHQASLDDTVNHSHIGTFWACHFMCATISAKGSRLSPLSRVWQGVPRGRRRALVVKTRTCAAAGRATTTLKDPS